MMPTTPSTRHSTEAVSPVTPARPGPAARTIMIVNGDDRAVPLLDAVLESGRYDVVFVESTAHAYSQIKRHRPNLVAVCTRPGDLGAFQVLTMLKLDEDTRSIPVLTCAIEDEGPEADGHGGAIGAEIEIPVPAPAGRPN